MGFHLAANSIASHLVQWLIGQLADSSHLNDLDDAINADPQAVQVSTITLDSISNSAVYTVTINGVDIAVTSDASAVNTEIVALFVAAINADPIVGGSVLASTGSATTVTVTGRTAGMVFTILDVDGKITCTTPTAAASAASIPFGRLVVGTAAGFSDGAKLCALAASGKLTAQVDTINVVYAAAERYIGSIDIDGESYPYDVLADTNTATTATAIAAAINARLPAVTVLAVAGATFVTLTAELAGKAFLASAGTVSGTVSRSSVTHTTAGVLTDLNKAALGISKHTYDEAETTVGSGVVVYPANAGVIIVKAGRVAVSCAEVVTAGAAVYVELGVSNDNGKFFAASSATRVKLLRATWERNERSSASDDVAIIRIAA